MMATQSSSSEFELPDRELLELQRQINAEARTGRINFFVRKTPDGEPTWAVIFQDGPRRATIYLHHRPSEGDVEDISTALASWATYHDEGQLYTTEVPREPGSEWS